MAFGGGFGQSSSSLFGASQPSLFDGSNQTGIFGNAGLSAPAMSSSAFGGPIQNSNTLWGGQGGPSLQLPPQGTRAAKWQYSQLYDSSGSAEASKFHSISAMEPFKEFSVEEMRLHDYSRGDKGGEQPQGQQAAFGGSFGAPQSQGVFGSGFGGAQSSNAFGAGGAGVFGASSSAFGPSAGFGTSGGVGFSGSGFGANQSNLFGGATAPGFGQTGSSTFGAQQGSSFGAQSAPFGGVGFGASAAQSSAFGAAPQTSAFGGSVFGGASGGFGASNFSSSAFGAPSAAAPLFGSASATQPTGGSIFGGGASQQKPATSLFGATSSSSLGASGAFGGNFVGGAGAQSTPSQFGGPGLGAFWSTSGAAPGSSLFASSTSALGFGSTGTSLFGGGSASAGGFGASSGSLFGSSSGGSIFGGSQAGPGIGLAGGFGGASGGGFGLGSFGTNMNQQQQQQAQGPLQASLTVNPFGESKLFAGTAGNPALQQSGAGALVVNTATVAGHSQGRPVSVIVGSTPKPYRRTRNSEVLARQTVMRRRSPGQSWYAASPMRPWSEEGPVFNLGSVFQENAERSRFADAKGLEKYATPWGSQDRRSRISNMKRIVLEPLPDDPVLRHCSSAHHGARDAALSRPARPENLRDSGPLTPAVRSAVPNLPKPGRPAQERNFRSVSEGVGRGPKAVAKRISQGSGGEDRVALPGGHERLELDSAAKVEAEAEADAEAATVAGDLGSDDNEGDADQSGVVKEAPRQRNARYSDVYRSPVPGPGGTRSDVGGNDRRVRSVRQMLPKSRDEHVELKPSLQEMSHMTPEQLSGVEGLSIRKEGVGEITWLEPVDVRGLDFDDIVLIKPREISVYPRDEDMPAAGEGLNKPARVKLFGISKIDKLTKQVRTDASTAAKMVSKLKAHCEREGLQFLGYDIATGTWTFQASSF